MPFDVRMPDGTIIANVPDGTPKDVIRQKWIKSQSQGYGPTEGMTPMDLGLAGAGKAAVDVGRGVGQMFGLVNRQDVADSRALDAPLMATTAGKLGNLAGNVAVLAPTTMIPGANTVTGAGVIGAISGLAQPSTSTQETLTNTALGGLAGAGGQKIGQVVGDKIGQVVANRAQMAADKQAVNAVRDATIKEARQVGYVIPPATINPASTTARAAESVAGKAATQQLASFKNQQVTNRLVRQELGVAKSTPLTYDTLSAIRQKAGGAYRAMKAVGEVKVDSQYLDDVLNLTRSVDEIAGSFGKINLAGSSEIKALQTALDQDKFSSSAAVELVKRLRSDASKNLAWNVEDPSKKALGLAQREAAGIVEDQLIRNLEATGKGSLAREFDSARRLIAKTYSVQSALNSGSGNVIAGKLAAQFRKGKPLSGNFDLIARFASTADKATKEVTDSPGVSALTAMLTSGTGLVGVAAGHPEALAVMALPAGRLAAQRTMLSAPVQAMAMPSYGPRNALLELMQQTAPLSSPIAVGVANSKQ